MERLVAVSLATGGGDGCNRTERVNDFDTAVDTPGKSEQAALAAAKAADLVLIPCRPQIYDLESLAAPPIETTLWPVPAVMLTVAPATAVVSMTVLVRASPELVLAGIGGEIYERLGLGNATEKTV